MLQAIWENEVARVAALLTIFSIVWTLVARRRPRAPLVQAFKIPFFLPPRIINALGELSHPALDQDAAVGQALRQINRAKQHADAMVFARQTFAMADVER